MSRGTLCSRANPGMEEEDMLVDQEVHRPLASRGLTYLLIPCSIVFLFILCLTSFLLGRAHTLHQYNVSSAIRTVSMDSPILHELDLGISIRQFNGSFFHENIFRGPASPEVDAAWESLGINYRPVAVAEAQAAAAGLINSEVEIAEEFGGGYIANVEGLHHLHCLDLLRQALYFNYEYYKQIGKGAFANNDYVLHAHVTHCLDILRQQLMCNVDVGMLGQVWWDQASPRAFPDFNTKHKCRDFEAVREWAERNQVPETVPAGYLQPPHKEHVLEAIP